MTNSLPSTLSSTLNTLADGATDELIETYYFLALELSRRYVLPPPSQTNNATAGAYAEWLAWRSVQERGARPSYAEEDADFILPDGTRIEVKATIGRPAKGRTPALVLKRPFRFDQLLAIAFDEALRIESAFRLSRDVLERFAPVNAESQVATLRLSAPLIVRNGVDDLTAEFRALAHHKTDPRHVPLPTQLSDLAAYLIRPPQKRISRRDYELIESAARVLDNPSSGNRGDIARALSDFAERKWKSKSLSSAHYELLKRSVGLLGLAEIEPA